MLIIAHRGNTNGPDPKTENREETIVSAITEGFDCEIDVWRIDGQLWLGHDGPEYATSLSFLETYQHALWVHCKNLDALIYLKDQFNCFFHDKDTYTLTSKGYIWGNIGSPTTEKVICVMPPGDHGVCLGVCTDFPMRIKSLHVCQ
jgi:glycerophosphoryl diester phosphodiesterase